MRNARKSNFNYLEHYTYFVPNVPELLILLLWFLLGALLGNVISAVFILILGPDAGTATGLVVAYPVMFIPPMIYASVKSRHRCINRSGIKLDSRNFSPVGFPLCALLVAVGTLALSYCADAVSVLLPDMPESLKKMMESLVTGNLLLNLLCVSVFAPVFEEWLCRGMVLRGLLGNNVKPVWAIVISAVFFAVIHLNPWQAVPAFMLGCLFGYVYYRTGSLKLTMLMHFVNNTFALVTSRIPALEGMENWRDVFAGTDFYVILAACAVMTGLVIYRISFVKVERPGLGGMEEVPSLFEQ